ncbi:MAG: capsular polysaccharide biosynthesis protein [Rhodobacteraceae bacterium]|nr:capsular polysaccharide biosynthesis protein [Paracoccaceae bacterium]
MPDILQAAGRESARLFVYDREFLTQPRLRRILSLAGYKMRLGLPGSLDLVAFLGNSPTADRGQRIAAKRGVGALRIENAFLGTLHPVCKSAPPVGLLLDRKARHFDATTPSDLETLLVTAPLDDTALLNRAREAMARMRAHHLSQYSGFDPALPAPAPGYVLVVDQPLDDPSVTASGGNRAAFLEMLVFAQEEHPGARVIITSHPDSGGGHYTASDATGRIDLLRDPLSPWTLLEGAIAVYTFSSHLGFEAIIAGHKPRVFGQPFYSGWGLTQDENQVPRRERRLTKAQLFGAAMIEYPTWYDPFQDCLCPLETVLDNLEARTRAWREDRQGWVASGMRRWKRKPLNRFFGHEQRMIFSDDTADANHPDRRHMVWAGQARADQSQAIRIEDGFIRSRGLGAELVPPLSLVCDDLGIYYDPRQPSRLERMIDERAVLTGAQRLRAERLLARLIATGISKYNIGGVHSDLPQGHRILVPGQVEDDASIRTGTTMINTNLDLLRAARTAHPKAVIIYKPHPDVEAGLRIGKVENAGSLADFVANHADPVRLVEDVDEVWTMTSLLGFEALLRGVKVTTVGAPFYAGWGLTNDRGEVPGRRRARPDLMGLVYATLIDYPRYCDPVTGLPCPVEVAVERLTSGRVGHPGLANRSLSKLQGLLSGYAHLWR